MTAASWIIETLGLDTLYAATTEASRRRLNNVFGLDSPKDLTDDRLKFIADTLELRVFDLLDGDDRPGLTSAAADAFQVARVLQVPDEPMDAARWLVRLGCLGILGERGADFKRILSNDVYPALPFDSDDWGVRVSATILDIWLRLFRKRGWEDLDAVQERVAELRSQQSQYEPTFLLDAETRGDVRPAWELIAAYHLAKAAETLGIYQSQGSVDGYFDIREQLEAHFDRATTAASRGQLMDLETFARLLHHASGHVGGQQYLDGNSFR